MAGDKKHQVQVEKSEVQNRDKEKLFQRGNYQAVGRLPKETVQFPPLDIFQDELA